MPLQLTDQQRNELVKQGINPDEYDFLTPEEAQAEQMPQSSASGAFTRSAVDAIPGIATGVGGAMATRAALLRYAPQIFKTARLSSPAGIASFVVEPLVGAAAGALGDWSVRRTIGPPSSWGYTGDQVERLRQARLQQEADMQQHPVASIGGAMVPQLAMGKIGFNPELKGALGALTGVSSRAAQTTLSLAEKRALAQAAINPAIVAGMSVGSPMLQGENIDWRQVLPQLALATVQQGGSWFEGKPATPPRVKGPGTLEEYVAGGGQDPEMIRQLSSSTGTKNKYKAPQPNKVGGIADNAPESGGSQEQDSWLNTYNQASDIIENQEALAQAMAAIQESIKSGKPLYDIPNERANNNPGLEDFRRKAAEQNQRAPEWNFTQRQAMWPDENSQVRTERPFENQSEPERPAEPAVETPVSKRSYSKAPYAGELINPPRVVLPNEYTTNPSEVITPENLSTERNIGDYGDLSRHGLQTTKSPKVVKELLSRGFSQEEIADMLDSTAISFYNSGARKYAEGNPKLKSKQTGNIGQKVKYQGPIKPGDYLSPENAERRLAQQAAMDTIAEFRGAKITGVKDIKDKFGNTKRGAAYSRQNIEDTARIEANVNREDQTTRPHEAMHVQLENMLKFGSAREKKIAERMLRAFNGDEEVLVQTAAENASKRDLGAGPRNIKSLGETPVWDNVRRRWRFFRDTATPEDYAIGLSDRTLNDPHFDERRAMLNPSRAIVAGAPKYQDDENQYIEGTSRELPEGAWKHKDWVDTFIDQGKFRSAARDPETVISARKGGFTVKPKQSKASYPKELEPTADIQQKQITKEEEFFRDYPWEHSQGLHNWLIDPEKYPKPAAPPYEITSHENWDALLADMRKKYDDRLLNYFADYSQPHSKNPYGGKRDWERDSAQMKEDAAKITALGANQLSPAEQQRAINRTQEAKAKFAKREIKPTANRSMPEELRSAWREKDAAYEEALKKLSDENSDARINQAIRDLKAEISRTKPTEYEQSTGETYGVKGPGTPIQRKAKLEQRLLKLQHERDRLIADVQAERKATYDEMWPPEQRHKGYTKPVIEASPERKPSTIPEFFQDTKHWGEEWNMPSVNESLGRYNPELSYSKEFQQKEPFAKTETQAREITGGTLKQRINRAPRNPLEFVDDPVQEESVFGVDKPHTPLMSEILAERRARNARQKAFEIDVPKLSDTLVADRMKISLAQGDESTQAWFTRLTERWYNDRDIAESKAKFGSGKLAEMTGTSKATLARQLDGWTPDKPLPKTLLQRLSELGAAEKLAGKVEFTPEQEQFIEKEAQMASKDIAQYNVHVDPDTIQSDIYNEIQAKNNLKTDSTFEENVRRIRYAVRSRYIREAGARGEAQNPNKRNVSDQQTVAGKEEGQTQSVNISDKIAAKNISQERSEKYPETFTAAGWKELLNQSNIIKEPRALELDKFYRQFKPTDQISIKQIADYIQTFAKENPRIIKDTRLEKFVENAHELLDEFVQRHNEKLEAGELQTAPEQDQLYDKNTEDENDLKYQDDSKDRSPWEPEKVSFDNKSDRYTNKTELSPTEEKPLTLGPLERAVGSFANTLRRKYGRSGEVLANGMSGFLSQANHKAGADNNYFVGTVNKLSSKDIDQLHKTLIAENRSGQVYRDRLPTNLQKPYDAIRSKIKELAQEAIDAGQPVLTPDGTAREREIIDTYFPNVTRLDVIEELVNRPASTKSQALKEDFINHQIKQRAADGMSEEAARTKGEELFDSYQAALRNTNTQSSTAVFSANRRVEGVGLPDSWIEPNFLRAMERYSTRNAYDRAYYDQVEKNPMMMKALGLNKDYYNRDIVHNEESSKLETVGGDDITFLKRVLQGKMNQSTPTVDAVSNLVTTMLTPGFSTGLWDITTSAVKQLGRSGTQLPQVLAGYVKTVGDVAKYYAGRGASGDVKAGLEQGLIRINRTLFEDQRQSATKLSDTINQTSRLFRKVLGREATETLSRSLSQTWGRVVGTPLRANALNGDAYSVSTMKKLFPEGGWKTASIDQIATRLAETVQGRYDPTELPRWVFDSNLAPYAKLQRWTIGQGNNFVKYLLDPIKQQPTNVENWGRLFTAVFGAGLAGTLIDKLKEELSNRKSGLPTYAELGDATTNQGRAALYKLAATADLAGSFGILGTVAAMAASKSVGKQAFGYGFPLVDGSERFANETSNFINAAINDPSLDNLQTITPEYLGKIAGILFGGANIVGGAYSRIDPDSTAANDRRIGEQYRDMSMYQLTKKGQVKYGPPPGAEDYGQTAIKAFKRSPRVDMDQIDAAADRVASTSRDPMELMNNIRSAKTTRRWAMPSQENPMEYISYYRHLVATQGEESARQHIMDDVRQYATDEVKKSLLEATIYKKVGLRGFARAR